MDIEHVREYALSLEKTTEDLFDENWLSFRVEGKWFVLIQLDAPQPRIAVKLPPELGEQLREQYRGVTPAYHMNKKHWNDLYIDELSDDFIREQILCSYNLVVSRLPHKIKEKVLG